MPASIAEPGGRARSVLRLAKLQFNVLPLQSFETGLLVLEVNTGPYLLYALVE